MESHDYDVIVTDLLMPGMSGEDLLGFVKAYRPETPVVFISGAADEERARRLLTKGAFDYLSKPFPLEEIGKRVMRAVEHRRHSPPGLNC
jgi:DNA-binding NtrC family response regulator